MILSNTSLRVGICSMRWICAVFFMILSGWGSAVAGPVQGSMATRPPLSLPTLKPLIVLDAGHGGSDEGAKVRSFQEKKVTLLTTLLTKKHLEELGYRVILTRSRDIYLSLPKRVSIANKAKGSLFVSIHFNASRSIDAHGIEVFYYNSNQLWRSRASQRLANCVLYRVIDQTDALSRGTKHGNFHVIRETDMPAILVEGGFLTHAGERDKLKDRAYLDQIAVGIAQGVDRYLKT